MLQLQLQLLLLIGVSWTVSLLFSSCFHFEGVASLPVRNPLPPVSTDDWLTEAAGHLYDTQRCNIDRLPWSTPYQLFREKYFLQKPVIFYPDSEAVWADFNKTRESWSRQNIVKLYGSVPVDLGTAHSLTAFGDGAIEMSLADYVADMRNVSGVSSTHYLFDRLRFLNSAPILHQSYLSAHHPHFDYRLHPDLYDTTMTFALGPSGSGISHHWHKDGWNQVLFGRKRWFLYSEKVGTPPFGYNQFEPVSVWYQKYYHLLTDDELPIECMQYEGEMFYVPETIFHSTINIGETVAVAGQTKSPQLGTQQFVISQGLDAKSLDQQLPMLNGALKMSSGRHAQVLSYIANAYRSNNKTAEAEEFYRKSIHYNPQYSSSFQLLGSLEIENQRWESAFDALIAAHELNPNNYELQLQIATCLYQTQQFQQAKEWLQRAIAVPCSNQTGEENSARMNAYVNLAVVYNELGQFQDCIRLYHQRSLLFPNEEALKLAAAECYRGMGQFQEAETLLGEMLSAAPKPFKLAARAMQMLERDRFIRGPPTNLQPNTRYATAEM